MFILNVNKKPATSLHIVLDNISVSTYKKFIMHLKAIKLSF